MSLSSESQFSMSALTEAMNKLPYNPTIIRDLKVFPFKPQTTTYVRVEEKNGQLSLVEAVPRGTPGESVNAGKVKARNFDMLHLPKHDVVRADDVQNVKAFGSNTKADTIASKVMDKIERMKGDIDYTREHLQLGALLGKICNTKGVAIIDIYQAFGLTRKVHMLKLSDAAEDVGLMLDKVLTYMNKQKKGESVNGWTVLCSESFMQSLVYHPSVTKQYVRYQDNAVYREGETHVAFKHKNITFVQYDHVFESGVQIREGEAIIYPNGTRSTFAEYFAPADKNATVNTKALPYYASREKLDHDKGWDLESQSNPLPMVTRPELVATLKMT